MEAGTLVYIAISLISLALSYGIYKKGDIETRSIQDKINKNRVSYSDVLALINKIKNKSAGLSLNKRNAIAGQLSKIGNSTYQSSGLSEQLMGDLRTRLNEVAEKIEKLRTMGDVESSMADNAMSAYAALSDSEKAKSKKTSKNSGIDIDPISKKVSGPGLEVWNGGEQWDPDTIGGRTMIEAEQHASKAKEYYDEANALGEKYAK